LRESPPHVGLGLLRCRLVTGRTHQIRVHLAARGWPIVGDPVYGEPLWAQAADRQLREALVSFPRQALHAWRLGMRHPMTGTRLEIVAPIPDDLQRLLSTAGLDNRRSRSSELRSPVKIAPRVGSGHEKTAVRSILVPDERTLRGETQFHDINAGAGGVWKRID
jgi:hypothetical protein